VTQQSCSAQIPIAPEHATGVVTGFLNDEQVLAINRFTEAQVGAKVNPTYLPLKHVWVQNPRLKTMAAVPEHMSVKIGDSVELNTRYRDPILSCHFIPWTINHLVNGAR
jgi:hypothetical protein